MAVLRSIPRAADPDVVTQALLLSRCGDGGVAVIWSSPYVSADLEEKSCVHDP